MHIGLVFGVTKRALSRVLVVMVSLGYSVVRPSLGAQMPRIAGLGMTYFVLAMSYDLLVNLPENNKHLGQPGYMDSLTGLVLLQALVDIMFYMWILQAIVTTISYLEKKGEAVKLTLFRRFRAVLMFSVVFSFAWSIYSMAASVDGYYEQHWQAQWSINAVWEVIYVIILISIAFLWMPSRNSQRYAYSSQLATSDPDDDPDKYDDDYDGEEDDVGTSGDFELPSTQEEGDLDAEYGGQLADHAKDSVEEGGE